MTAWLASQYKFIQKLILSDNLDEIWCFKNIYHDNSENVNNEGSTVNPLLHSPLKSKSDSLKLN